MIRINKRLLFLLLPLVFCQSLFAQNEIHRFAGNPIIDSLLLVLKNAKTDSVKAKTLNDLAFKSWMLTWPTGGDFEPVKKMANEALLFAQKINDKRQEALAINTMAFILRQEGNFPEALKNIFIVLRISEEIGDGPCAAVQYLNIGDIYFIQGNFSEALKNHFTSLEMWEKLGAEKNGTVLCSRIGEDYYRLGNNDTALKYFSLALENAEMHFAKIRIGVSYNGLGKVYKNLCDYPRALKYHFAALKIMEEEENKFYMAECYIGIGNVYLEKAGFIKSTPAKESYKNGLLFFYKGLLLAKQARAKNYILDAYSGLTETYKGINDYKNALQYTTLYSQLKDSIYNNNSYSKATEIIIQYEAEKAATAEKARLEKMKSEKQQNRNLLMLSSAAFIIIAVFLTLILRQRNLRKSALKKAETVHKMAELEMQSLRSQLNPHFMFNSLNSIQALILKEDNDKSQSYLSRFARLLRMLLENADKQFIPLRMEMEFLQLYLSLEGLRVPDMHYSISTDPVLNTEQILIPNMILQPYVENAIWHGLSHKETDKQLRIRVFRENGTINYEIEDNGVGRKKAGELKSIFRQQHQSKGMELISKRIELLNKEYSSIIQTEVTDVIKNKEVTGTLVSIKVPLTFSEHSQN